VVVHAAGCDKQDSLMRGGLCGKLHGQPWQFDRTAAVIDPIARYSSRIAIFAYPTCFDAPVNIIFGHGKTRTVWLPDREK